MTAFVLRQCLRDEGQEVLLPILEDIFNQEAAGDEVLHIPKIQLSVTFPSEEKMVGLQRGLICEQLNAQLRKIFRELPTSAQTKIEKQAIAQRSRLQVLLHYLRTGGVKWEVAGISAGDLAAELQGVCRERLRELSRLLRAEHAPSLEFCFRLLQLMPTDDAGVVARLFFGETSFPWQASLLEIISSLLASEQKRFGRYAQLHLAAMFLSEALAARSNQTAPDFALIARRALPFEDDALQRFFVSLPAFNEIRRLRSKTAFFAASSAIPQKQDSSAEAFSSERLSRSEPKTDKEFPLLAAHVGLVLLHPFLRRFLEGVGIKENEQAEFSSSALPRAAALLHFVATGQDTIHEFGLAFIKVLLGLDPETPLCVAEGLIVEEDKQEADALLQAAVTHWTALKGTSVAGLRTSFIQRRGLLRADESGWKLQVEREPFDVLLEHLPWSTSVVKLPWMKHPLYTEW